MKPQTSLWNEGGKEIRPEKIIRSGDVELIVHPEAEGAGRSCIVRQIIRDHRGEPMGTTLAFDLHNLSDLSEAVRQAEKWMRKQRR